MERARTGVDTAKDAVVAARELLARWEAEEVAAAADIEQLQASAGERLLEDPAASQDLARQMQAARDRQENAGRAVEAARPRVTVAERAYLAAEADALEPAVRLARAALEKHQARTQALLAELAEHECPHVPEHLLIRKGRRAGDGPVSWQTPKSEILQEELARAELPVNVLRAMAEGRDPQPLVDQAIRERLLDSAEAVYPVCVWGADALVKAPQYLKVAERAETRERQRAEAIQAARDHVARLEATVASGEKDPPRGEWGLQPPSWATQLERARRQLKKLEG